VSDGLAVRGRIRLRETHVRDHLAPLVSRGAAGALKLDLLLRGLAALPPEGDESSRQAGVVPESWSWEALHDAVRGGQFLETDGILKRKWTNGKLSQLERLGVLRREIRPGRRSGLVVPRDDGSGLPFDDPGASASPYVTVLGTVFSSGRAVGWGAPQLAAYLAAMIAERYARSDPLFQRLQEDLRFGGGMWFRPLRWFADEAETRPESHVRIPFSERTLRRGVRLLRAEGVLGTRRIGHDPRTAEPFAGEITRVLYFNGFDDLRPGRQLGRARARTYNPRSG
jgi:hypothetical protein